MDTTNLALAGDWAWESYHRSGSEDKPPILYRVSVPLQAESIVVRSHDLRHSVACGGDRWPRGDFRAA